MTVQKITSALHETTLFELKRLINAEILGIHSTEGKLTGSWNDDYHFSGQFSSQSKLLVKIKNDHFYWDIHSELLGDCLAGYNTTAIQMAKKPYLINPQLLKPLNSFINLRRTIKAIMVYGRENTYKRKKDDSVELSKSFSILVNLDSLLIFHFKDGGKMIILSNNRDSGINCSLLPKEFPGKIDVILDRKNQYGEKIFNLKHTIE